MNRYQTHIHSCWIWSVLILFAFGGALAAEEENESNIHLSGAAYSDSKLLSGVEIVFITADKKKIVSESLKKMKSDYKDYQQASQKIKQAESDCAKEKKCAKDEYNARIESSKSNSSSTSNNKSSIKCNAESLKDEIDRIELKYDAILDKQRSARKKNRQTFEQTFEQLVATIRKTLADAESDSGVIGCKTDRSGKFSIDLPKAGEYYIVVLASATTYGSGKVDYICYSVKIDSSVKSLKIKSDEFEMSK